MDKTFTNTFSTSGLHANIYREGNLSKKVQVGNDQEMVISERNSHSINRGVGKNLKRHLGTYTRKTYSKPSEQLLSKRRSHSYLH